MQEGSLQPSLEEAQRMLEAALDEACGVDVKGADTGELIRMEETLATASRAAKDAVSVRLRLRERGESRSADQERRTAAAQDEPVTQREFDDGGKRWRVFAVRPSGERAGRSSLPATHQHGWLSFESDDEVRRVVPIPQGWEEMSVEALRALCASARSAPRRLGGQDASQQGQPPGDSQR